MQINFSGSTSSLIVSASEEIRKLQKETGKEYLFLNRGVNSVCNINLTQVIPKIDFNSDDVQVYPMARGRSGLRNAINKEYFNGKSNYNNIIITAGGISGLDISFQNIKVDKVLLPSFFWGTYTKVLTLRKTVYDFYDNIFELGERSDQLRNTAIVVCDPGNPLGIKDDDSAIVRVIKQLSDAGVIVIVDSPYRRIFYDNSDSFYHDIGMHENVIIVESFSKSVGLSGLRIGFIHSTDNVFKEEFAKRLLYATNGVNSFSQVLIENLLITPEGKKAVHDFKRKTSDDIALNIDYLIKLGLLPEELYDGRIPMGIFVTVNKTEEELLQYRIGSIPLTYFTEIHRDKAINYSRICVSIPHEKFIKFFSPFKN